LKGFPPAFPAPGYRGSRNPSGEISGAALGAKGKDYIIKNYDVMNLFFMFDLFERKIHDLTWIIPIYRTKLFNK
jgi:hypothetical protein